MNNIIIKYTLILTTLFLAGTSSAQNNLQKSDDFGRITLNTYVSDQIDYLPISAEGILVNKLNQIATYNGLGGSSYNPRFIITPNISILTKDITPTAPPMMALTLNVAFYIGDGLSGVLYESTSIQVKGVGTNETKAYISALKQIKPTSETVQNFIKKGKTKIIEYYNSNCDFILKEAKMLESQNKFYEAIAVLTSVPEVCKDCFDKSMDAVAPIYQKYMDRECKINLNKAKNAWSAGQDYNAANDASYYLNKIDPLSSCFNEVEELTKIISKRIKEIDNREWNFVVKKQQDNVNITNARIKAARDVGVSYGTNQPKETYNIRSWW